tara:strand:+ start:3068 stop:3463 length:396 start_codon:yes stop_codon:yes gene_type:complete
MKNLTSYQITLDRIAVYLSAICAVQCLALPIAMLFLPSLSVLPVSEELFHTLLLYLVIPVSIFAMVMGCKKHKSYNIIFYGALGLSILLVSAIYGHDLFGESGEIAATLVGASVLSFGHIKNQKLCKECCH